LSEDRPTGRRRASEETRDPQRQKTGVNPPVPPDAPEQSSHNTSGTEKAFAAQRAIGSFLRSTRTAQKLTQEQVAALTKDSPWQLSRAAISAIERGQNFPGLEAMLALSNVLFVDPQELIERARLATTVPVDVTGLDYEELKDRAKRHFWNGEFREALALYDAMIEMMVLEENPTEQTRERAARIEVSRASALRRTGALSAAVQSAERAIGMAAGHASIQAEGYVVLAGLQCDRGHLPLAGDAAQRAVELSADGDLRTQGWAWVVKASTLYMSGNYDGARQAYLEARSRAVEAKDTQHQTHIEGNIGMCWQALGQLAEARTWVRRAVELARQQGQPTLEASWLVELGKISAQDRRDDEADGHAQAALRIAKPIEHQITVFRAEWLRHRIAKQKDPDQTDRHRLAYLRKLFLGLDQYQGVEEVREFRSQVILAVESKDRKKP
jgi:transcriptional regulator with XRE-family HTH domain